MDIDRILTISIQEVLDSRRGTVPAPLSSLSVTSAHRAMLTVVDTAIQILQDAPGYADDQYMIDALKPRLQGTSKENLQLLLSLLSRYREEKVAPSSDA